MYPKLSKRAVKILQLREYKYKLAIEANRNIVTIDRWIKNSPETLHKPTIKRAIEKVTGLSENEIFEKV